VAVVLPALGASTIRTCRAARGSELIHQEQVDVAGGRPVEGRRPEVEDTAVGRHEPVATATRARGHAVDGLVEVHGTGRALKGRVAVTEDAAVGGHQPVAVPRRRSRHADDGRIECRAPVEPKNEASPKLKTPPSEATSH
jgi:hypothetical protein